MLTLFTLVALVAIALLVVRDLFPDDYVNPAYTMNRTGRTVRVLLLIAAVALIVFSWRGWVVIPRHPWHP